MERASESALLPVRLAGKCARSLRFPYLRTYRLAGNWTKGCHSLCGQYFLVTGSKLNRRINTHASLPGINAHAANVKSLKNKDKTSEKRKYFRPGVWITTNSARQICFLEIREKILLLPQSRNHESKCQMNNICRRHNVRYATCVSI